MGRHEPLEWHCHVQTSSVSYAAYCVWFGQQCSASWQGKSPPRHLDKCDRILWYRTVQFTAEHVVFALTCVLICTCGYWCLVSGALQFLLESASFKDHVCVQLYVCVRACMHACIHKCMHLLSCAACAVSFLIRTAVRCAWHCLIDHLLC